MNTNLVQQSRSLAVLNSNSAEAKRENTTTAATTTTKNQHKAISRNGRTNKYLKKVEKREQKVKYLH